MLLKTFPWVTPKMTSFPSGETASRSALHKKGPQVWGHRQCGVGKIQTREPRRRALPACGGSEGSGEAGAEALKRKIHGSLPLSLRDRTNRRSCTILAWVCETQRALLMDFEAGFEASRRRCSSIMAETDGRGCDSDLHVKTAPERRLSSGNNSPAMLLHQSDPRHNFRDSPETIDSCCATRQKGSQRHAEEECSSRRPHSSNAFEHVSLLLNLGSSGNSLQDVESFASDATTMDHCVTSMKTPTTGDLAPSTQRAWLCDKDDSFKQDNDDVFLNLCSILDEAAITSSSRESNSLETRQTQGSDQGTQATTALPSSRSLGSSPLAGSAGRYSDLSSHAMTLTSNIITPGEDTASASPGSRGAASESGSATSSPSLRPRQLSSAATARDGSRFRMSSAGEGLAGGCWDMDMADKDGVGEAGEGTAQPQQQAKGSTFDRKSGSFEAVDIDDLVHRARHEEWMLNPKDIVYEEKLGEGDCAVVYKARWRSMSVVSKMLRNVGTDHETDSCLSAKRARADLMNEISLLSHLRHPNLALFLGACLSGDGSLCLISEHMSGGSLEDFFESKSHAHARQVSGNGFDADLRELVLSWTQDLCQALCFLHNCNPVIIHRDLKPANLLLDDHMKLKVCDFSLSRSMKRSKLSNPYKMTGCTGTVRYMAPEVMIANDRGEFSYNEKVDIYSAACLVWYMVMGKRPLGGLPVETMMSGVTRGLRPDLFAFERKVGADVSKLVSEGWAGDPTLRPSAEQMVGRVKEMRQTVMRGDKGSTSKSPSSVARRFFQTVRNKIPFMSSSRPTSPEPFARGGGTSSSSVNSYLQSPFSTSPPTATRSRFASSEIRNKEACKPASLLTSPESRPGLIRGNDAGRVLFPDVRQHGSLKNLPTQEKALFQKGSAFSSSCHSVMSSNSN